MDRDEFENLPSCVREYIGLVLKKMRYRREIRREVRAELLGHFVDGLADCEDAKDRERIGEKLVAGFGDIKMLGKLIKRGKKRCRPLWQKVLVRSLLGLCGLIVFFVLYAIWFFTGEATFSVNYLVRLNEMARPKMAAKDNGWTDYEKAIELFVAPDEEMKKLLPETPWSQLSPKQHKVFSDWVDQNEQAWEQYVAGSRKAYCYREYDVGDEEDHPMLIAVVLPHLIEMRDLSKLGVSMSRKHAEEGNIAQSVDACLAVIRCGWHWQGSETLIEQLVGWAIERIGYDQMAAILDSADLSAAQISDIDQQLADIASKGYREVSVEFERISFLDIVQHSFTKGGPGGGHIIVKAYQMLGDGGELFAYMGAGLIHAGRNRTVAEGNKLYDRMEKTVKLSPYQRSTSDVEYVDDVLKTLSKHRYGLLQMFVPAFERVSDIRYQSKSTHEAMLTLLGIKRWGKEKGSPPESLEQLKEAGYLKTLPDDPYSDGVLRYIKKDNDFVLYSIGVDFQDNGGKENPDNRWGRPRGGDRVFWPLASEKWSPVEQGIDDQ